MANGSDAQRGTSTTNRTASPYATWLRPFRPGEALAHGAFSHKYFFPPKVSPPIFGRKVTNLSAVAYEMVFQDGLNLAKKESWRGVGDFEMGLERQKSPKGCGFAL